LMLSRVGFMWQHIFVFLAFTLLYLLVTWIRFFANRDAGFPYSFLDYRHTDNGSGYVAGDRKNVGVVVGFYFGMCLWGLLAAAIVVLISRIKKFYNRNPRI
jgi:hypothetical protein